MLYMTYAGAAPSLVSCGNHQFEEKTAKERCNALNGLLGDFKRFYFFRNFLKNFSLGLKVLVVTILL